MATLAGCAAPERTELPAPTRGVLMLTLSGLSAGALSPKSAPFLSELASRSLDFDWALAPGASTLASGVGLLTGLPPAEAGIDHILRRPGPEIETLAARFTRFGFTTGGFTDGGFASRAWGFERGFDHFAQADGGPAQSPRSRPTATTLERSLRFLDELAPGERFLLFVHLSALAPPWTGGVDFAAVRQGALDLEGGPDGSADGGLVEQHAAYLAALAKLDGELRAYFAEIERRGLLPGTTIAVVGDHGEEFFEHGRLGHDQLYPEVTRVPLYLVHPTLPARHVAGMVRTIDLGPTLALLAGLPPATDRSQSPRSEGVAAPLPSLLDPPAAMAWAETFDAVLQRSVWTDSALGDAGGSGGLYQLVETRVEAERDGAWVSRRVAFDAEVPEPAAGPAGLDLVLVSFAQQRVIELRVDGDLREELVVPRQWRTVRVEMPPGRHHLELATDACAVPADRGMGADPRCLSFKVKEPALLRVELFELRSDPAAQHDLSNRQPEIRDRLAALLGSMPSEPVAWPEPLQRTPQIKAYLNALGYLDWGE